MTDDPFILLADADGFRAAGVPLHPLTAKRMSERGEFPKPVFISPHRSGWFLSQLRDFMQSHKPAA